MNRWQRGWVTRWERAWELGDESKLGPKGQDYIASKYGEEVYPEDFPEDYHDEFDDYDVDVEY
jgi:hypothetical protein